jgi:hypothetical protein
MVIIFSRVLIILLLADVSDALCYSKSYFQIKSKSDPRDVDS